MKSTIILILSIMLVGCKSTTGEKTLSDIETLMDCRPDSALNKLNKITPEQLTSDETNAYYALLYSQALDKNYIDTTNDSLILIAENYYTKHNDNKKSMLAHYYHGRVKYNAKEYPQSLYFITKAFHNAESLKDYYWMGRCAEEISIIYDENFHGSDALHYAQVAFDNLQKSGKQPYINYSLLNLARINNNNNNDSIANQIAKQVLDSAIAYNDSSLWILSKNISAKSFFGLKDYNKTILTINEIKNKTSIKSDLRCLHGLSYLAVGEYPKANKILNEINENYCLDDLSLIYEVSKTQGDIPTALSALSELYYNLDSVFRYSMKLNFNQKLSELHNYEQETYKSELNKAKTSKIVITISGIICIIAISLYGYRKYTTKLDRNIIIAQNLQDIIRLKQTKFSEAQESIKKLLSTRFEVIDDLCKTIYETKITESTKRKISSEVEKFIYQFSSDKQKIVELEMFANKIHSNIISSFKADLPNLKESDYLLFLFHIFGIIS